MASHVKTTNSFIKTSIIYALGILFVLALQLSGATPAQILGTAGGLMGGYLTLDITRAGPWSTETITTFFWM